MISERIDLKRILLIFLLVSISFACIRNIPSIEEYTKYWVGKPVEDIKNIVSSSESYGSRIGWHETTYKLENGNWVYVEPDKKDCFIHWKVNPQGIIVSYRLVGDSCY